MGNKIIKLNKNKENNKKQEQYTEVMKVSIELEKTDIYLLSVEVPLTKDNKNNYEKINIQAITTAWDVINKKLINLDKALIGSAFSQKILGRKKINISEEVKKD